MSGKNQIVSGRSTTLSSFPKMTYGNKPADGGHLLLNEEEKIDLLSRNKNAINFIKKLTGSVEFINGGCRYCIWIEDDKLPLASSIHEIGKRINDVKKFRLDSKEIATQEKAENAHQLC